MSLANHVVPFLVWVFHLHAGFNITMTVKVIWLRVLWIALVPEEKTRFLISVVVPKKFVFIASVV